MDCKQQQEFFDDLDAFLMAETLSFDTSNFFDEIELDEQGVAVTTLVDENKQKKPHSEGLFRQRKNKPLPSFGKGKDLETVLLALSAQNPPPPSTQNPPSPTSSCTTRNPDKAKLDWNDEEKIVSSKRKLHLAYQEDKNKRRKIQLIDIKNLPVPEPQRRNCNKKNLLSSSNCPVF